MDKDIDERAWQLYQKRSFPLTNEELQDNKYRKYIENTTLFAMCRVSVVFNDCVKEFKKVFTGDNNENKTD